MTGPPPAPPASGRGVSEIEPTNGNGTTKSPSRLREGLGVGQSGPCESGQGKFKPRNTERARTLRNNATPAERLLWHYLNNSQLGVKFSRQMQVGPFFADFLCRSEKLIIEIDGWSHDINPGKDVYRDKAMRELGYRIMHFQNSDVLGNVEGVVMSIRLALGDWPTPNPSRKREGS